jgi:hypothetical protein
MSVFRNVAQYSLVEVYRRFRGTCCIHHQGYRTSRGAVIDEYGAMLGWWLAGETRRIRRKSSSSARIEILAFFYGTYVLGCSLIILLRIAVIEKEFPCRFLFQSTVTCTPNSAGRAEEIEENFIIYTLCLISLRKNLNKVRENGLNWTWRKWV